MPKDGLDKTSEALKRGIDKTKDAIHEAAHRGAAEGEKVRRDAAGDEMTMGEKARSVANEAKHRTQAEIDAAKRKLR